MFIDLKNAITRQFDLMKAHQLYRTQVTKDQLWETYLESYPPEANRIHKVRREHDCSCCKSFIRSVGDVVAIIDGRLVSLWDVEVGGEFQPVVDAMSTLVKLYSIDNVFLHTEKTAGTDKSRQLLPNNEIVTWDHFYLQLPPAYVKKGADIGPTLSETRSTHDVFLRALKEITLDSIDTVLELIAQNSLYRGEEHKFVLTEFRKLKKEFNSAPLGDKQQDLFVWEKLKTVPPSVSRIRSTVIGTLLADLSEGYDLDDAVKSFESKVAPANYKRPTALVTKAMIKSAQEKIENLGFTSALERRYAVLEDITINNILFADRQAKKTLNVFEELSSRVPETKNLDKVEEVSIERFVTDILPKAESLEVLFENRHTGNLVSLIAPVHADSKNMFKWPNNFSWSYAGEVADSIKERVKKAGGRVDGYLRCSLSWYNYDDLDLRMIEPTPKGSPHDEIYYAHRVSHVTRGNLDVDMNAGGGTTRNAVENITYPDKKHLLEGDYKLYVQNYAQRETIDTGFEVEVEYEGKVFHFSYPKAVKTKENIPVAEFRYSKTKGLEIVKSLPSSQTSKTVWGVPTETFHKANVVMLSPNHWDERAIGNKHYFFMLDGCANEDKARGFFNEFLTQELDAHRKVIEVVGAKMKTDNSDRQLSGLGFSSTQRNSLLVRVKGSFTRTVKVVF